ncbi:MAG: hypothetical protein PSV35_08080, partial [bacterium]|nr:hypothetical protein [bacterium]
KAFAQQNVLTTDLEINNHVNDVIARLAGQKALVELLDNKYRPPNEKEGDRDIAFPPLEDGQPRRMFVASHEILQKMDADVLKLEKQIQAIKTERLATVSQIDENIAAARSKLDGQSNELGSNKNVTQLNTEWNAIRRMVEGIKKFFSSFTTDHHVKVKQDATGFFDEQFKLPTIIARDVSATIKLEFAPPEYYDINKDMLAQSKHLNGIAQSTIEERAQSTVIGANKIVEAEAGNVESRIAVIKVKELEIQAQKDPLQAVISEKSGAEYTNKYKELLVEVRATVDSQAERRKDALDEVVGQATSLGHINKFKASLGEVRATVASKELPTVASKEIPTGSVQIK